MKINATHTPGPWKARPDNSTHNGATYRTVVLVEDNGPRYQWVQVHSDRLHADAQLIEAAPELLETLVECIAEMPAGDAMTQATLRKARALVRRVTA